MEAALKEVFNVHRNVVRGLRAQLQKITNEKEEVEKRLEKKCSHLQHEVQSLKKEKQYFLTALMTRSLTGPDLESISSLCETESKGDQFLVTSVNKIGTKDVNSSLSVEVLEKQMKAVEQILSAIVNRENHPILLDKSSPNDKTYESNSPVEVKNLDVNKTESQQPSPLSDSTIPNRDFISDLSDHSSNMKTLNGTSSRRNSISTDKGKLTDSKLREDIPMKSFNLTSDGNTSASFEGEVIDISQGAENENSTVRPEDDGWSDTLAPHSSRRDSGASQIVKSEIRREENSNKAEANCPVALARSELTLCKVSSTGSKLQQVQGSSKRRHVTEDFQGTKRYKMSENGTASQKIMSQQIVSSSVSQKTFRLVDATKQASHSSWTAPAEDVTAVTDCNMVVIPETIAVEVYSDCEDTCVGQFRGNGPSKHASKRVAEEKQDCRKGGGLCNNFSQSDSICSSQQMMSRTDSIIFGRSECVPPTNMLQGVCEPLLAIVPQEARLCEEDSPVFCSHKPHIDVSPALFDEAICEDQKFNNPASCLNSVLPGHMNQNCGNRFVHPKSPSTPNKSPGSPLLLRPPLFHDQHCQKSPSLLKPAHTTSQSSPCQLKFDRRKLRLTKLSGGNEKLLLSAQDKYFIKHGLDNGSEISNRSLDRGSADETIDPAFSVPEAVADQTKGTSSMTSSREYEPLNASLDPNICLTQLIQDTEKGPGDETLSSSPHQTLTKDVTGTLVSQDKCVTNTSHSKGLKTATEQLNRNVLGKDAALHKDMTDSFDIVPKKSKRPEFAYREVVRKKDQRRQMKGFTCQECIKYYCSAGLSKEEIAAKATHCSRHRAYYNPPSTPEHFWSIGFPDTQECVERGYQK